MKHRILCLIFALTFVFTALAACSGDKKADDEETVQNGHPLYIRVSSDADDVSVTFSSTHSDATHSPALKKVDDEEKTTVYRCYEDAKAYDRVTVTIDERDSDPLAFNAYVSGWELSPGRELPFTYGKTSEKPKYERKEFPYQKRSKGIEIWTPEGYDAKSDKKYSVIYMTDGHNLFEPTATSTGCWAVAESVSAMMAQSDHQAIIVGVENMDGWRDEELTPNIGEAADPGYQDGQGDYFCDFVMDAVVPYIGENYNVYTDREHTAICGSSSGGIESFYIAMEHPEKFGTVGALSPAFGLFDNATWKKYLAEKDFSAGYPRVYLYCGKGDRLEQYLYPGFQSMPDNLKTIGYPTENIYSVDCKKAVHNELYWRIVFPDFLSFLFSE